MEDLLIVENLRVTFTGRHRVVEAVRGVSLRMGREKLGIVGESGSGKTVTGRALLGLVRPPGRMMADRLEFAGQDLLKNDGRNWRKLRGGQISMVMQDPRFSLNPVMTVGRQIGEVCRLHRGLRGTAAEKETVEMLRAVRINDAERVCKLYPHEVSGGMAQRIMIAMMLVSRPDLLIADEPTSALDVTVQIQLLDVLNDLVNQRGMGLIFISHDLKLVASFCDRVVVMYGGRIVEVCRADQLHQAQHPYTRGLLNCQPSIDQPVDSLPVLQRDPAWLEETDGTRALKEHP